jgi:hypothetical protein
MVGKPNFPPDVEEREDLKGAAMVTEGLNALDEEREASMADEGGWSGAVLESQEARVPTEMLVGPTTPDCASKPWFMSALARRGVPALALGALAGALVGVAARRQRVRAAQKTPEPLSFALYGLLGGALLGGAAMCWRG